MGTEQSGQVVSSMSDVDNGRSRPIVFPLTNLCLPQSVKIKTARTLLFELSFLCRRWESNPHERNAHYALNVARLPISPLRLSRAVVYQRFSKSQYFGRISPIFGGTHVNP